MVDNLIDPARSDHAVLSQIFPEQPEDLLPTDRAPLDQAYRHPEVFDQGLGTGGALLGLRHRGFLLFLEG